MPDSANTICGIATEVSKYPCVTYLDDVHLSDGLLSGSIKNAAVVACSDVVAGSNMGACVPFVCSSESVELFLFQNFGHHFDTGGMVETIVGRGVKNVVVYGHSDCEYMKFLAKSEEDFEDEDQRRLYATAVESHDEDQRRLYTTAGKSKSEADWKIVGQYNVLNELKKMLADPVLAPLATNGRIQMHGWFYNSATRQIEVFEPKQKAFIAVTQ